MRLVTQNPECSIVTANKPLVDALLAMNTHNRTARQTAIDRLKIDIEAGTWKLTASGVGVDTLGRLSDGQHRLLAIKQAGYPPVQFVLATGLDPDAQSVVDRHAKRSLADALSLLQGRTISTAIVAAANVLLLYKNATSKDQPFAFSGGQPSDSRAAANLLEWEDDLVAVMQAVGCSARASVVAALAIYHRHDHDGAIELGDQIKRGTGLSETDPAYKLRATLQTSTTKGGGSQAALRAFCYTVSAVIAHAQGRSIRILRASESWAQNPWKVWKA